MIVAQPLLLQLGRNPTLALHPSLLEVVLYFCAELCICVLLAATRELVLNLLAFPSSAAADACCVEWQTFCVEWPTTPQLCQYDSGVVGSRHSTSTPLQLHSIGQAAVISGVVQHVGVPMGAGADGPAEVSEGWVPARPQQQPATLLHAQGVASAGTAAGWPSRACSRRVLSGWRSPWTPQTSPTSAVTRTRSSAR